MTQLTFRTINQADISEILGIYNYYLATTTITFDELPITQEELLTRISINSQKYPSYMITSSDNAPIGFCYFTAFRKKAAYIGTAEIGVYLRPEYTSQGIGKQVVEFLEKQAKECEVKTIIASISGENAASIKLFQKSGYEQCAHYRNIAEKFGRLLDIVDFQKTLD